MLIHRNLPRRHLMPFLQPVTMASAAWLRNHPHPLPALAAAAAAMPSCHRRCRHHLTLCMGRARAFRRVCSLRYLLLCITASSHKAGSGQRAPRKRGRGHLSYASGSRRLPAVAAAQQLCWPRTAVPAPALEASEGCGCATAHRRCRECRPQQPEPCTGTSECSDGVL